MDVNNKPNWEKIDEMIGAKQNHIDKAEIEGFETLSQAIHDLMAGTKYKRILEIGKALGMSSNTMNKYRNKMFYLGVECANRPKGFEVTKKVSSINGGKGKKRSSCPKYISYNDDIRFEIPECDKFGFTRGFYRETSCSVR